MKEIQKENKLVKCIACMVRCFLQVLEKFVKFFNKHAYTEVSLRSTNFCTSAINGMKIITLNFMRFGVMHGIVMIVTNFVSLFVSIATCVTSYYILREYRDEGKDVKDVTLYLGPLLVIFRANS